MASKAAITCADCVTPLSPSSSLAQALIPHIEALLDYQDGPAAVRVLVTVSLSGNVPPPSLIKVLVDIAMKQCHTLSPRDLIDLMLCISFTNNYSAERFNRLLEHLEGRTDHLATRDLVTLLKTLSIQARAAVPRGPRRRITCCHCVYSIVYNSCTFMRASMKFFQRRVDMV